MLDGAAVSVLVRPQRMGEVEGAAIQEVLRVNLHPALRVVQTILPGMKARSWGRVVNIWKRRADCSCGRQSGTGQLHA
jgi:3-oxoacyl-[acyl-carrier protein] reductase